MTLSLWLEANKIQAQGYWTNSAFYDEKKTKQLIKYLKKKNNYGLCHYYLLGLFAIIFTCIIFKVEAKYNFIKFGLILSSLYRYQKSFFFKSHRSYTDSGFPPEPDRNIVKEL